jgi:hypothetical protein
VVVECEEVVDVNDEAGLVAGEDLEAVFEVFAVVLLLIVSSPHTPVSQGLVEQHPV